MARSQIINILVYMLLRSVSLQSIHRMSCRNEAIFKSKSKGFMVKPDSTKLISNEHASSLHICARSCVKRSECESFLYNKILKVQIEKNCQLLMAESSNIALTDIQNITGWIYYEPLQQGTSRCQPSTCQAGFRCVETCDPSVATGYNCIDINECESSPCQNGATCNNLLNAYSCTCAPGYTGKNCESEINECISSPCLNGGACNDLVNAYSCTCAAGYTGTNCQTDVNECGSAPCSNGATCNDMVNAYSCTCAPGYTGTNCQTNINECGSSPCLNGGTCNDLVNAYSCTCAASYTGTNCQSAIVCSSSSCSFCMDRPDNDICCSSGRFGPNCEASSITYIRSPNYPSNYGNSYSNSWLLSVPSGKLILYFYDFITESCCDKVYLRDGSSSSSPLIATLSGTTGKHKYFIASGSYMYVTFKTDGSVINRGFKAYKGYI